MLSEIVIAAAAAGQGKPRTGLSISGIFPCPWHIYKSWTGWGDLPPIEGEQILNMENGWYQEEESIKDLARAGLRIENRQLEVTVGKSKRKGHIDGTVKVQDKIHLWEHKAKSSQSFHMLKELGLSKAPDIKCQVNLYMKGLRELDFKVDQAVIYLKHRETNIPYDFLVPYESDFVDMVIEWVDKIVLGSWVPPQEECLFCPTCYMQKQCFGVDFLDLSGIRSLEDSELVQKWRLGKMYQDFGKELVDSTREIFKDKFEASELGAGEILMVGPLRVKKYIQHRQEFNKSSFIEKFGAVALLDVMESKDVPGYRIDDTEQ